MLRTPGYVSWQGERWMVHCDDAAAFLGPAGWDELRHHPDALESLREQGWPEEDGWHLIGTDDSMSGYLFRCRHCGRHLAYVDSE